MINHMRRVPALVGKDQKIEKEQLVLYRFQKSEPPSNLKQTLAIVAIQLLTSLTSN